MNYEKLLRAYMDEVIDEEGIDVYMDEDNIFYRLEDKISKEELYELKRISDQIRARRGF